jgi:hypothetical protein
MRVTTFLFICKEFFDQLNPNLIDDEEENDIESNREREEMNEEIVKDLDKLSELFKNIFFFMNYENQKLD